VSELAGQADGIFFELEAEHMNFWRANSAVYFSLSDVIMLDDLLTERSHQLPEQFREATQTFHTMLPFSEEERAMLAQELKKYPGEAAEWHNQTSPAEILLLDRWRRWLDEAFDEDLLDEPGNKGRALRALLHTLEGMDEYFPELDD